MSEKIGTISYSDGGEVFIGRDYEKTKPYSEKTAGSIDDEVKELIDEAYRRCTQIIEKNRDRLEAVAGFLLQHDTMSRSQFEAVMAGQDAPQDAPVFQAFRPDAGAAEADGETPEGSIPAPPPAEEADSSDSASDTSPEA